MDITFFSGYGFAPMFFMIMTGFIALIFGIDTDNERTMGWLLLIDGILTGLVVIWLQLEKKKDPDFKRIPKENTLIFIPVAYWPFILIAIGLGKIA